VLPILPGPRTFCTAYKPDAHFFFFAIFCRVPPQGFDITEGYLDGLLVRLRDKGVSVRKTVVGILRDVLLYQVHTHTPR